MRAGQRDDALDPGARVGLVLIAIVAAIAILGPFVAPFDPIRILPEGLNADGSPVGPSARLRLRPDTTGRSELSRPLQGGQRSRGGGAWGLYWSYPSKEALRDAVVRLHARQPGAVAPLVGRARALPLVIGQAGAGAYLVRWVGRQRGRGQRRDRRMQHLPVRALDHFGLRCSLFMRREVATLGLRLLGNSQFLGRNHLSLSLIHI